MSESFPTTVVTLKLDTGTLYAIPDGGQVRLFTGSNLVLNASFPFTVQITPLSGNFPLPPGGPATQGPQGYTFVIPVRSVPSTPSAPPPPAFKYTIIGGGAAAGRALDPIIIVDKKPQ